MANNFTIVISAVDKSSGAFKSAGGSLMELERKMQRANHAIPRMGAVESFVARSALVTGGVLAGVAGAVGLITAKILSIESTWANTVRAVSNKSLTLGVDPRQLMGLQNAGKLVGLSPDQVTTGVEGVSRGFYEAQQGRDPTKRAVYQAYGISGTGADGQFSPEALIEQIAAAGERVNSKNGPLARHHLFDLLGATGIEDLLNKGQAGVQSRYQQGLAMAPTDDDIQHAKDYADAMSKLDIQFDKVKASILGGLAPALTDLLKDVDRIVERATGKPASQTARTVGDRIADAAEILGNGLRGNGPVTNLQRDAGPVGTAIGYYEAHGLPRTAAIGLAANQERESGYDERSVGDNGKAYGISQWHPDRQADFKSRYGFDIRDASTQQQMDFTMYELFAGKEKSAGAALLQASNPADAADVVSRLYERPKDSEGEARTRAQLANQIDGLYAKGPPQADDSSKSDDASASRKPSELKVKVELGNLPKGSRTEISGSPDITSTVQTGSTGRTDQFAMGATY